MKTKKLVFYVLLLGILLLMGVTGVLLFNRSNNPLSGQIGVLPQASPASASSLPPIPTLELAPGSTRVPQPTPFSAINWGKPPSCASQPMNPNGVAQILAAPTTGNATAAESAADMDLRRAALLSPKLASLSQNEVKTLFANKNAEISVYGKRAFVSLAINIATGRLNRASEVSFAGLPDVKTVGDLLSSLEDNLAGSTASPALVKAAQQVQNGQGITQAVCAHLLITQSGNQPVDLRWAAAGIQAQNVQAKPEDKTPFVMDTVTASPDGRWAAYTSVGNDSGGPVYLLNLASGGWTNLIDQVNANLADGQAALPANGWWDVIGWMPDSQRIMLSPADGSVVYLIDSVSGKFTLIPFKGGGNGGGMFVGLATDGRQFAYIGESDSGDGQTLNLYNLETNQSTMVTKLAYSEGTVYFPRFSPDGKSIAYVVQKGQPDTGMSQSINLIPLDKPGGVVLTAGNLGLSEPVWSPDGQYLAITKKDSNLPDKISPEHPLDQPVQNIWVVSTAADKIQQLTFIQGQALRPKWASDAKTLSFVTQDGQVGLVSIDAPGQIWRAAETSPQNPNFTSGSFVP